VRLIANKEEFDLELNNFSPVYGGFLDSVEKLQCLTADDLALYY
jgi:hypothetical protein